MIVPNATTSRKTTTEEVIAKAKKHNSLRRKDLVNRPDSSKAKFASTQKFTFKDDSITGEKLRKYQSKDLIPPAGSLTERTKEGRNRFSFLTGDKGFAS
jgi:hypothetical protein